MDKLASNLSTTIPPSIELYKSFISISFPFVLYVNVTTKMSLMVAANFEIDDLSHRLELRNNILVKLSETLIEITIFIFQIDVCIIVINARLDQFKIFKHASNQNDVAGFRSKVNSGTPITKATCTSLHEKWALIYFAAYLSIS